MHVQSGLRHQSPRKTWEGSRVCISSRWDWFWKTTGNELVERQLPKQQKGFPQTNGWNIPWRQCSWICLTVSSPNLCWMIWWQLNVYSKRRKVGYHYAFDSSKTKIGIKILRNWLGLALCNINLPWSNRQLSKDAARVLLKKSYYG